MYLSLFFFYFLNVILGALNEVLSMSNVEDGAMRLELRLISIRSLVLASMKVVQEQAERKGVVVLVELTAHAGVLGALAGEDEHDFARRQVRRRVVLSQAGMGQVSSHRMQGIQQVLAGISAGAVFGDRGAIRVMSAGGGQAIGQVGQFQIRMTGQVVI